MSEQKHIIYNPQLSIEQNAIANNVSQSAVRNYLYRHKLDRRSDNARLLCKRVQELKKKNEGISIAEISRLIGCSYKTAKKYFYIDSLELLPHFENGKDSTTDMTKLKTIIKSYSSNQDEIIGWILRLYIPNMRFDADLTYSVGNFYKRNPQPRLKFDKYPQLEEVSPLEEFDSVEDNSLESVIFDLPFLSHIPQGNFHKIESRFTAFESLEELISTHKDFILIARQKLKKCGVLVVKTQDFIHFGGKQVWMHNLIENFALENGFEMLDTFILLSKTTPLGANPNGIQRHSRKLHSYFIVFKKGNKAQ